MEMEIRSPTTAQEFEQYYDLRYRLLREPWGHPKGSEQDSSEDKSIHIALYENKRLLGIAQLTLNSADEGQVRYVAVEQFTQSRGIGNILMQEVEQRAHQAGLQRLVLNARDYAIPFYEKCGYQVVGEARPSKYLTVPHMKMEKFL